MRAVWVAKLIQFSQAQIIPDPQCWVFALLRPSRTMFPQGLSMPGSFLASLKPQSFRRFAMSFRGVNAGGWGDCLRESTRVSLVEASQLEEKAFQGLRAKV